MTHIICRLTAKNWNQLRNPTLGRPNRVWAIITFYVIVDKSMCFIVIRLIATLLYDYYTVSACIKCLKLS